jgi:hypothetical protein
MSNIDASADSVEELEPIVARIRQRWPAVKIWLRGDGGFCREKLMAWCEREGMEYIFGLAQNARLKKLIEAQMAEAEKQHQETKAPARVFTEFLYSTQDTWSRERCFITRPTRPMTICRLPEEVIQSGRARRSSGSSRTPWKRAPTTEQ